MFVLIATVLLLVIHQGQCGMNATALLHPDNSPLELGTLTFTQDNANAPVCIAGSVIGLNASSTHGFHIHVFGVEEGEPNCTAAGPHFNPYNTKHGPPSADITERHVGDLGNLTADAEGTVDVAMNDSIIQLYNATQSIINRAVVIHLFRDDGGQGGYDDSNTTGNAGPRIVCGLIKLSSEDTTTTSQTTTGMTPESTTTTTMMPTTTTIENTTTTIDNTTTIHSRGLNIQPIMFVFIIVMIIGYIIPY